MKRPALVLALVVAFVLLGAAAALGAWSVPPTATRVTGKAGELPRGPKPHVALLGQKQGVGIAWPAIGVPAYRVTRQRDGAHVCEVKVRSCIDPEGAPGDRYTVRALHGAWVGPEGPRSDAVPDRTGPKPKEPDHVAPKHKEAPSTEPDTPAAQPIQATPTTPAPTATATPTPSAEATPTRSG